MNALLRDLLARVRAILAERFVGLYLYGSLAGGDFDPNRSDIDFVVVTDRELPDAVIADLEAMHVLLASSGLKWAQKLEGAYVPAQALRRYDPDDPPRPTVNDGRFYLGKQGSEWVIQRHILREQGAVVAGPPLREMIDPVASRELIGAVQAILREWWAPMLQDPARLEAPGYQPYAVLTMCRALYTLQHGALVSKSEAARWASAALDQEWEGLIERALAWRWGDEANSIERTLEFMKYTLGRSEQFQAPDA